MEEDQGVNGALRPAANCPIDIVTFIYLATPYSHPEESVRNWNYVQAKRTTGSLMAARLPVFCPIVHCHPIAVSHDLPLDAEYWWDYNLRFMEASSLIGIAYIGGWDRSLGVDKEIRWARMNNKPILAVDVTSNGPTFRELD